MDKHFNPRPPRGGRRIASYPAGTDIRFQSTPPARGATSASSSPIGVTTDFNPRPPRGGRPFDASNHYCIVDISIHAPREGGDCLFLRLILSLGIFQSTPPARGATLCFCAGVPVFFDFNPRPPRGGRLTQREGKKRQHQISIHAPREGGDSKDAQFYL